MIKTMIVDDEYLVRQGLLHILPWKSFNMEIVGEADNGETALELLEKLDIDLLITDLTMPVMNGFELMEKVRAKYPHLSVVVLTCHQEFAYVQDALKLGALDYMVKTQLEKERVEEVLSRITERISQLREVRLTRREATAAQKVSWGLFLISKFAGQHVEGLLSTEWSSSGIFQVNARSWFLPRLDGSDYASDTERLRAIMDPNHWEIVIVHEIEKYDASAVSARLQDFMANEWMYEREPDKHIYYLSYKRRAVRKGESSKEQNADWRKLWQRFAWVYDTADWEALREEIAGAKPPFEELKQLIVSTLESWSPMFRNGEAAMRTEELKASKHWRELSERLHRLREPLIRAADSFHLSKEVSMSILQAIDYMKRELHNGINQEDVASNVNISRGYFSKCFKDMVGVPFNELMKTFRIQRAMELLTTTRIPVYRIAEQAGFQDERYFSKVFRDVTGMLPSEYRSANALHDGLN